MPIGQLTDQLRHLRKLALQRENPVSDSQLLDSFLEKTDDAAFEALVIRHGPMVLGVCRRILKNAADVEDAFQATFLVLVRKAAGIARRELVANWLYGVAFRAAMKMKQAKYTRQSKERQAQHMAKKEAIPQEIPDETLRWLDHELHQLQEKYRAPVVLCDLEGMTRIEAARKLRCPIGTLNWRLAKAREMLAKRLARHGFTVGGGALVAVFQNIASASVPTPLLASTVQIGTLLAAGQAASPLLVSARVASLTEGLVKGMFLSKLKIVVAMILVLGAIGAGAGGVAFCGLTPEKDPKPPAAEQRPNAADQETIHVGGLRISAKKLTVDKDRNLLWADGPGSITLPTSVDLKGEKLSEPKDLVIQWTKDMLLDGKHADFHGDVRVSQDNAVLKCSDLYLTLDRSIASKDGQKEAQGARIEKVVCDLKVVLEEKRKDQSGNWRHFYRQTATQISLDHLDGPAIAIGKGKVEQLTVNSPMTDPRAPSRGKPEPEGKVLRVLFENRMFAGTKENVRQAKYYGNVELFHFAADDLGAEMNPGKPPKNGFYLRCNILHVSSRQVAKQPSALLKAEGNVFFRTSGFFAKAGTVTYDQSQESVIFEGSKGNAPVLYRKRPGQAEIQEITGTKILYNFKTGVIQVEGGVVITEAGTASFETRTWITDN